jgi:transglycosylase-like protein
MMARLTAVAVLLAPLAAIPHQPPVRAVRVAFVVGNRPHRAHEHRQQVPVVAATQARADRVAVRASRNHVRPPLAERSRWSTSARPTVSRAASTALRSHARAASSTSGSSSAATTTDLQRAHALPEPWRSIVRCESLRDGSWRVASPSHARGWFQFLPSTWRSLGMSGDAAMASFSTQYAAARRLAARDGLRAWDCARLLHFVP